MNPAGQETIRLSALATVQNGMRKSEATRLFVVSRWALYNWLERKKGAETHWSNEMGLRSDWQAGTSFGLKGHTPVISGTGQRFRCNMISSITNRGTLRFMVFDRRFTAAVFIDFLSRLARQSEQKVFLIMDGHPVHRAAKVKRWLAVKRDRLEMFSLPGYSPELNLDELLNQDVKSNALGRRRPPNKTELIEDVRGYLRSTQKTPQVVRNFFQERHVRCAARMYTIMGPMEHEIDILQRQIHNRFSWR